MLRSLGIIVVIIVFLSVVSANLFNGSTHVFLFVFMIVVLYRLTNGMQSFDKKVKAIEIEYCDLVETKPVRKDINS